MARNKKRIHLSDDEEHESPHAEHTFINNSDYSEPAALPPASMLPRSTRPGSPGEIRGPGAETSASSREPSGMEAVSSLTPEKRGTATDTCMVSPVRRLRLLLLLLLPISVAGSPSSADLLVFEDAPDSQPLGGSEPEAAAVAAADTAHGRAEAQSETGGARLRRPASAPQSGMRDGFRRESLHALPTSDAQLIRATTPAMDAPLRPGAPGSTGSHEMLSFSQQQVTILSPTKRRHRESMLAPDTQKPAPRLVISKLVLTDFKSYAGVQEIGPFNASFSAVVGPNGSGKSNVIDLMLFVFGFRALKMRQGKLLELIHNSVAGLAIDHCQVDVHFVHVIDDPTMPGLLSPVPGSELVVSRRAFRSNGSQYYVNGRPSSYTEVTLYLRAQGIDLDHKRFLILQGEVELIAQMKAKAERDSDDGLLEYLEDIIGTSGYKLRIEASASQIEALNETCVEKETRFVLVESDAAAMEDKKAEALRFLDKERALSSKRGIKFQAVLYEHQRVLAENERLAGEIGEKLEEEKTKNTGIARELEAAHEQKASLLSGLESLASDATRVHKKQKSVKSQLVLLEEKLRNVRSKEKKIQKVKAASEATLAASTLRRANLTAENEKSTAHLKELETSLGTEKETLRDLRLSLTEKTAHLSAEILELQTKLEPFQDRVQAQDRALELVQSEISMLEAQKRELDMRLKDESMRLVRIKADGKAKEADLEALTRKLTHISEQMTLGEEQCSALKKMLQGKRVRLASARLKTLDAASRLATVQNKNAVLVSLTKLSKSGRITGFYGRLGDLGIIDDKYDVAVSTACPALDSMVVDTVETAQACIDYLRKNRLGYANFICLNKLQKFNLGPIRTPGSPMTVKRIFDLITPQDLVFLPAFYSKLRDTLVASNLQEAKSVAYGPTRFKVVTVDGKVVDTSGTMSGGGHNSARGGMKLRSNATTNDSEFSEDDVAAMRNELQGMESEVLKLDVELHEMEVNLRKLKELKPETELAIQTAQLDITSLVNEGKEVSKNIKLLLAEKESTTASSEVDTAIEAKQRELDEIVKSRESLKQQMLESESRIVILEEKIMEAGGIALKAQNSKIDSIKQQIEIIQEKASADLIALKKLDNEIKRHTKIIAESEIELTLADEDCVVIERELTENRNAWKELDEQLNALQVQINKRESLVEKLELSLEELTVKLNEFKSEEIELRNQLEKVQGVQRRCRKSIEEAEAALEDTVIRDIGPYLEWMTEEERSDFDRSDPHTFTEQEIRAINMNEVEEEIKELETYMSEVKVDVEILKEYGLKRKELDMRREELNESVQQRDGIKNHCEELKRKRLDEFMEGFNMISLSLKEMYQMITMGGNAELELVDSLDPFSEGILFSVMPPKKSWKNISNLSGGEKTLSSLALVFALHKYKPTPLYVMDEIDAALDFRNVSIVANYIKERTRNAQFIVISLRNNMFELAQQLVGIYKVSNKTRSVSIKNEVLFAEEEEDQSK